MNHDGYIFYQFKTCFCEFISKDYISYLIYSEKKNILVCYDIINKQVLNRIIKDKGPIIDIRHYLDNKHKIDLILNAFIDKEIEISEIGNYY